MRNLRDHIYLLLAFLMISSQVCAESAIRPYISVLNCFRLQTSTAPQDSVKEKFNQEELEVYLSGYQHPKKTEWISSRGKEHFDNLKKLAHKLEELFESQYFESISHLSKHYGAYGKISSRSKRQESIISKLLRKDLASFGRGEAGIRTLGDAAEAIGDGIGARIFFNADDFGKIHPATIQKFVDQMATDIAKGNLRVTELINYRAAGEGGLPYFTLDQINQIKMADQAFILNQTKKKQAGYQVDIPRPMVIKEGPQFSFENGYSSVHLNVIYPTGVTGEIQVKGALMQEAAQIDHVFYDLRTGKKVSEELRKNPVIDAAVVSYGKLNEQEKKIFNDYIRARLTHARYTEAGLKSSPPQFPGELPQSLNFDVLKPHLIHD